MKAIGTLITFLIVVTLSFGQKAPDFTVTDYEGITHKLYDDYLSEGKVVMLKIMFVACPPCNAAAPAIQDLYEVFGQGQMDVQFFDLSNKSWDSNASLETYSDKHGLTFPGVGADGGALSAVGPYVAGTWGTFRGTPTYVVIEPDGKVNFNVSLSNLKDVIDEALDPSGGGGGGGGCTTAFAGEVESTEAPLSVLLRSDVPGAQVYKLNEDNALDFSYNCEFPFPPQADSYYLTVEKDDDDILGVTTKDIVFTVRHLLGLELFESSAQKIAADFTANNTVSAKDISEMRKLILGVNADNPWHDSWRFWNLDTDFSDDSSAVLIPDLLTRVPLMDVVDSVTTGDFKGVKLGDVSGDINTFLTGPNQTRSNFNLYYQDKFVQSDDMVTVEIYSHSPIEVSGIQGGFIVDGMQRAIATDTELDLHIRDDANQLNLIAYTPYEVHLEEGQGIFELKFRAKRSGLISEMLKQSSEGTQPFILFGDNVETRFDLIPEMMIDDLRLYPNPSVDRVTILSPLTIRSITVVDANGKTLAIEKDITDKRASIDVSQLNSGVYFVITQSDKGKEFSRLIRQ